MGHLALAIRPTVLQRFSFWEPSAGQRALPSDTLTSFLLCSGASSALVVSGSDFCFTFPLGQWHVGTSLSAGFKQNMFGGYG